MTLEEIQKVDSVIDQIDLDSIIKYTFFTCKIPRTLKRKRLSLKSYEVKYNTLLKEEVVMVYR